MSKSQKFSPQRLDVIESICAFLQTDPREPSLAPRVITTPQLVAWEKTCTNPEGFRQTSERLSTHINKDLPINAMGNRKTVLRFPQWIREYTTSRGVYDFNKILREYNEALTTVTK
jgi:hypothetical protein